MSLTTVDLTHLKAEVKPHVNSGWNNLNLFLQILTTFQRKKAKSADDSLNDVISSLAVYAHKAYEDFEMAYDKTLNYKKNVDKKLEKSVLSKNQYSSKLSTLEHSVFAKEKRIEFLTEDIKGWEINLRNSEKQLRFAEESLRTAIENRKSYDGIELLSAAGFLAVPVVGYVYGLWYAAGVGVASLVTNSAVSEAEEKVSRARNHARNIQYSVNDKRNQIKRLKEEIPNLQIEKKFLEESMFRLIKEVELLKKDQKKVHEIQLILSKFVSYLSSTYVRVKVLRDETSNMYSIEPLRNVVKELFSHLETSPEALLPNPKVLYASRKLLMESEEIDLCILIYTFIFLLVVSFFIVFVFIWDLEICVSFVNTSFHLF